MKRPPVLRANEKSQDKGGTKLNVFNKALSLILRLGPSYFSFFFSVLKCPFYDKIMVMGANRVSFLSFLNIRNLGERKSRQPYNDTPPHFIWQGEESSSL